jgi:hypothetical protein
MTARPSTIQVTLITPIWKRWMGAVSPASGS